MNNFLYNNFVMNFKFRFISKQDFSDFFNTLCIDNNIYYLTDEMTYQKFADGDITHLRIDTIRAIVPLKTFFFVQNEKMKLPEKLYKKTKIIFGVKSCDLKSKRILDEVYLNGVVVDPFYELHNNNTLIFSSDCLEPLETCFCNLVNGKPYCDISEYKFDLNFSPVKDGYIVEIGTERGERIVDETKSFFENLTDEQLSEREKIRQNAMDMLNKINFEFLNLKNINLQEVMSRKFQSELWKELSKNCVQCTGCNNICPSCYCFYLTETEDMTKIRHWDACQWASYGRVGGGLNPRPKLFERFRNRYECKFNYRFINFGIYGCSGCGRCISVCPGKIDVRRVLNSLVLSV